MNPFNQAARETEQRPPTLHILYEILSRFHCIKMYLQSSVGRPVVPRINESAAVEAWRMLAALASTVAVSPQSLSCSINKQKDRLWLTKISVHLE